MAEHYRRKQTRRNITAMYLDNYHCTKSYSEIQQLERYMMAVTEAQREAELRQAKDSQHNGKQTDLFGGGGD